MSSERRPGMLLVLSAPSGAGKTTLAHRFRAPEGAESTRSSPGPRSLDILHLLPHALDLRLGAHHDGGDLCALRLRADGVHLAVHLLHEEVELPAGGLAASEERARLGEVAAEPRHLLRDVGAVGEERDLLREAGGVEGDAARELLHALGAALDALVAMRAREGEALARDLSGRLDTVEGLVGRAAALVPQTVEHHRARLAERVQELSRGIPIDPARLAQEVALFADRTDVTEEVTRLRSHLAQARALLAGDEPAGRKLDFLVQEMHREVNTIGSKSQSAEIAAIVVSAKAEVERMREQVQNVE